MNNLKAQFEGFYNTPALFETLNDIRQFEFEAIEYKKHDYAKFEILQKLPLGKRVEYFFEEYIKLSNRYNLIYKNIQVIENKNTLGELDFILFDKKTQLYLHTELVYKFYLYDNSFNEEINRYIGPNRDDTLLKKLEKLKTKQFPLLFRDETKNYIDIDLKNVFQNSCFKANIFLPYKKDVKTSLINKSCIKGFHINIIEFLKLPEFKEYKYFLPHRYDWILDASSSTTWKNYGEIQEEIQVFLDLKKSPLVWLKSQTDYKVFFITWW
ncbi:DUF1853 family protein [Arcobacter roscoffensis]|uniref:DUF1853 family protein n=1 Tax=Arcobacter roscoffensis TaxID=2961520 RepID=A0ABY5DYM6_9BACT|nr:DUF1853 family protein [Arcobacter roscoffensis]UTJ05072.1 DUF1853 family protein [Arcobacter roscoffensis]